MSQPIKFIHASDFHLDVAIRGLAELPKHLIEVLANAPYDAAAQVFDLAIAERVDFVLLAGDLFNLEAGHARAAAFLLNQFERLAEKEIAVYWVAGECDHPDRWPPSIELPDNVVTFNSTVVEQLAHRRDGKLIARILACGFDSKRRSGNPFVAPDDGVFNIALTHGQFESSSFSGQHVHYWALGGRHKPAKLEKPDTVVVYAGTPQGRHPDEPGPHGFKLCRVDSSGNLKVQTVESDRVRFLPQKVAISEQAQLPELKNELSERALKIIAETTDQVVLSSWFLSTEGEFNPGIRKSDWTGEVLEWLREQFGRSAKGLWSLSVDVEDPKQIPGDWFEEDTLLGEYLRAIGRFQTDDSLKLNLHPYMPQSVKNKVTTGMTEVAAERRDDVLKRATLVGVEYLGSHKEFDLELETEA